MALGYLDGSGGYKAHPCQPPLYLFTNTASHRAIHGRRLICISLTRSRADTTLATSLVTREI